MPGSILAHRSGHSTLGRVQIRAAGSLANQQIATQLVITLGTAKWHVSQIFEKLGVRNRAQAITKARQLKLS